MFHIAICDDDPTFLESFSKRITELPDFRPKSMVLHCMKEIPSEMSFAQYDLIFMDIDMGTISGIDIARRLRKENCDAVLIFVTNFKEYAPEGYEVNAFRYLAKAEIELKLPSYFADALILCQELRHTVEIQCGGEAIPVPVHALIYIESLGRKQHMFLKNGPREEFFTCTTMADLEALLFPHGFLRIHKSYLVNMAHIEAFQSTCAVLTTGQSLPVSARNYRANKQHYLNWIWRVDV